MKVVTEQKTKNELFPVFLKLSELKIVLIGGGNVALEKLNSILSNAPTAKIKIIAPEIRPEIEELVKNHITISLHYRKFEYTDIDQSDILICATDNSNLHQDIYTLAKAHNILINVADTPDLCDFYMSSIVQKGNLKIAISTNGQSPTAAKRIKELLQDVIPEEIDDLLNDLRIIRDKLKGDFKYKVDKMMDITKDLGADI